MATYTYTTNADEDAALAKQLPIVNGQLVSQGQPPVDLQGMWKILMFQRLQPLVSIALSEQAAPLLEKFRAADAAGRAQLLASATDLKVP